MFLCLSTDLALWGNSIKPTGLIPQPWGTFLSLVEGRILERVKAFSGPPLSFFLVIQNGGEEGPSSRFVALVKNYFSLLEFPATERFPNEFSQGCKHTGSYFSPLGEAWPSRQPHALLEPWKDGLKAVEGRQLDATQALIKPTAPAVLNHCLAWCSLGHKHNVSSLG